MLLEGKNLVKRFGNLRAINNLTFEVEEGKIFAIVGPNGSGKTTLYNLITKVLAPDEGEIFFEGQRIDKLKPHQICRLGIARTFQIPAFFPTMPVWEQVMVGAIFGKPRSGEAVESAKRALESVGLADKADAPTSILRTYDKKLLMIATALATEPKLLLLDEPLAGLQAPEVAQSLNLVRKLRETGITIMIIEHNMRAVMEIADHVLVLHHGEKLAEGPPSRVAKDPNVITVYLGEEYL